MRERMTRVVFAGGGTGGHLYPGLAIARALVRARPGVEPFFVGALRGIERDVLPKTEFPHLLLDLHPLYRARPGRTAKTVRGAVGAWRELGAHGRARSVRRLVVGTGGYAAGVVLAYASSHRIPIVQQAGDSHPGLTARAFSRWSREIYLGFPEAARMLSGARTRIARRHRRADRAAADRRVPTARRRAQRGAFRRPAAACCSIYGGSQGSRAINRVVAEWVRARAARRICIVIWVTGRASYDEFASLEGERVRVRDYLSPIADAYAASRPRARARRRDDDGRAVRLGNSRRSRAAADRGGRPPDGERRALERGGRGDPPAAVGAHRRTRSTRRCARLLANPARARPSRRTAPRRARARRARETTSRGAYSALVDRTHASLLSSVVRSRRIFRAVTPCLSSTPADPRPIHFVGIAGAGMSALAELFAAPRRRASPGATRIRSTRRTSQRSASSSRRTIPRTSIGARALVVTSAMPKDHPELVRARELGIPVIRRAEALGEATAGASSSASPARTARRRRP